MKKRLIAYPLALIFALVFYQYGRSIWHPVALKLIGKQTVSDVIDKYGTKTKDKLTPLFSKAGISYPPKKISACRF